MPRPSPSPEGKPESSNKELKDSMWGVTNSFKILYVEPFFWGFRKDFSRARVLNDGVREGPVIFDIQVWLQWKIALSAR